MAIKKIADAILETRLVENFEDDDFWLSVIRFFIRNPMLDTVHINPLVDYIHNQRFENRVEFVERGVAQELGPQQPNFTMRGRTVQTLLNDVDEWHRRLGREVKSGKLQWTKSKVHDFKFIEGDKQSKNMKIWRITELLTSQELISEGRALNHCVATYANSCKNGRSTIWTLDCQTEEGTEKLLTIELDQKTKTIKQIRGKRNRLATEKEKNVIYRWVDTEGLKVAAYL